MTESLTPRRGLSVAKRPQPPLRLPKSQPYLALSPDAERGDNVWLMPAIGELTRLVFFP